MKPCPCCAAKNKDEAILCVYCKTLLDEVPVEAEKPGGVPWEERVRANRKEEKVELRGSADVRVNQKKQVKAALTFVLIWAAFLICVAFAGFYAWSSYLRRCEEAIVKRFQEAQKTAAPDAVDGRFV